MRSKPRRRTRLGTRASRRSWQRPPSGDDERASRWTQKLGEAFLAQEQDVMDSVQRMRARAYDRKKLETTREQVVSVKQEQSRQLISIEPAVPDALYVPYYEPQVVYGDWPYADY